MADFPELYRASDAAQGHLGRYTGDPRGPREYVKPQQRVSDRDRFMQMAAQRAKTGALTGSSQGVLDKFRSNTAGTIGSTVSGGMEKAGIATDDISDQMRRAVEAENMIADIRIGDEEAARTMAISGEQIDAQKDKQNMQNLVNLGTTLGTAGSKKWANEGEFKKRNMWERLGGMFRSTPTSVADMTPEEAMLAYHDQNFKKG